MNRPRNGGNGYLIRPLALGLCVSILGAGALSGAEAPGTQEVAQPDDGQVVPLEYRELSHAVASWSLWTQSRQAQNAPFAKEPKLSSLVSRGTLRFLASPKDEIRFIWDRSEGKLWLDLNRNGDLSDDPSGMFTSPLTRQSGDSRNHAEFKSIPVSYGLPEGRARGLMDVNLMAYGDQVSTTVNWRSCWLGKARLQGRDWQIGLLPKIGPRQGNRMLFDLLLRPWERQAEPFLIGEASADSLAFAENIFLGLEGYRLTSKFESREETLQASLLVRSFAPELVEVDLKGQHIRRLTLERRNPALTVILDEPGAVVKLPVGEYNDPKVFLKKGDAEAYRQARYYGSSQPASFKLIAGERGSLAVGGPLTNLVSAQRRGAALSMDYQLVGADGQKYQLSRSDRDRSKPPAFTVSRAGKVLHSGNFEFG